MRRVQAFVRDRGRRGVRRVRWMGIYFCRVGFYDFCYSMGQRLHFFSLDCGFRFYSLAWLGGMHWLQDLRRMGQTQQGLLQILLAAGASTGDSDDSSTYT